MATFGERLRRHRLSKHLTQKDFGKKFKLSESAIGMYERGEREPSFSLVQRFAEFFDVSVGDLIGGGYVNPTRDTDEIDPDIQAQLLRIQEKSKLAHIQGALPRSSSQASLKKHLDTYETILDEIIKENQKR